MKTKFGLFQKKGYLFQGETGKSCYTNLCSLTALIDKNVDAPGHQIIRRIRRKGDYKGHTIKADREIKREGKY